MHISKKSSTFARSFACMTQNRIVEKRQNKMKYTVIIEETLRKEVAIEAQDAEEAARIAKALYRKGKLVLDAGDFIGEPTITCI